MTSPYGALTDLATLPATSSHRALISMQESHGQHGHHGKPVTGQDILGWRTLTTNQFSSLPTKGILINVAEFP